MVSALRQAFLYSEKRARDILFREMEGVVGENPPPTVSRLTREAALRGREQARRITYDLANWNTAAKATVNAMLGAGALLASESRPIPLTVAAQATPVVALADGYQDLTEAYLLEFLIHKLGDVTSRDHIALAHALFRQFDPAVSIEDLEDRVAILLATLSDRVMIAPGGTYMAAGN